MSYDLYLKYKTPIQAPQFWNYFAHEPHAERQTNQIFYNNKTTGVYFFFNPIISSSDEISEIHININYMRPSAFGLEAEHAIAYFIEAFPGDIHDPQINGMGDGPYTREGFLRGWNTGNALGYSVIRKSNTDLSKFLILSSSDIREMWRWNYSILTRDAKPNRPDQFLPTIFAMRIRGEGGRTVIWGNAVAAQLPKIDFILYHRKKPEMTLSVLSWDSLKMILNRYGFQETSLGFDLTYKAPPEALVAELNALPTLHVARDITRISFDHVLDSEILYEKKDVPSQITSISTVKKSFFSRFLDRKS